MPLFHRCQAIDEIDHLRKTIVDLTVDNLTLRAELNKTHNELSITRVSLHQSNLRLSELRDNLRQVSYHISCIESLITWPNLRQHWAALIERTIP